MAGIEIERKYIIKLPSIDDMKNEAGYTVSRITQIYINSPAGVTHRVRKREYADKTVYTETRKTRIDKMSVVITLILAFVFLHEQFTMKSLIGCLLIGAGTLIMVL
jgi:CYTH domain-containing protein